MRYRNAEYKTERQADLAKIEINKRDAVLNEILRDNEVEVNYFLNFSPSTRDMFEDFLHRILMAFGVDS